MIVTLKRSDPPSDMWMIITEDGETDFVRDEGNWISDRVSGSEGKFEAEKIKEGWRLVRAVGDA